jgi:hypothetical protein
VAAAGALAVSAAVALAAVAPGATGNSFKWFERLPSVGARGESTV